MLGRPTATSIALSVLADRDTQGSVEYGPRIGDYPTRTPAQRFSAGQPVEVLLSALQPNAQCFYRAQWGDHGVSVVFHGHDHSYARQELDAMVYQEVPQPGWVGDATPGQATQYGYVSGKMMASSGHLGGA
jgi:hypothetical protein